VSNVLIIEDDATIRTAEIRALNASGHSTMSTPTALEGLQQIIAQTPDVVLLDLGLPDLDGQALLAMIRAVSNVPVIVVSARDDGPEIVAALDAGADDYLVKPFAADQLEARIRAVLRRVEADQPTGPVVVGGLVIDERARTCLPRRYGAGAQPEGVRPPPVPVAAPRSRHLQAGDPRRGLAPAVRRR
jgi:DNA-binding response OmpR family regulator